MRLLQEILSADQGSTPPSGQPTAVGGSSFGGYGHHGYAATPLTAENYHSSAYANTGAGDSTIWIMMGSVTIGYLILFFVMSTMFFHRRTPGQAATFAQPQVAFVRFPESDELPEQQKHGPVSELEQSWRKAFITKVYSLLVIQIAITLVISFVMMQFGGYDFYVWTRREGAWTRMASFMITFATLIALFCQKSRFPMNLVLLLVFTTTMSYTIGVICVAYAAAGMQIIVIEAFAITSLLFIALTIFTIKSKMDFSFLGLILPILLFILIIWGLFAMIAFPSFQIMQAYALAGTLIFSLYVLYDTWMITTYLSYDDYVLGAINLYLDFINLFLMILQLLMGMRRE